MIGTIGSALYIVMSVMTTWFNYEMLKYLTETKRRTVTDPYYAQHPGWKIMYEGVCFWLLFILNIFIWPVMTPLLWFSEWYRKPGNRNHWKNPMRWAIREVFEPKENI